MGEGASGALPSGECIGSIEARNKIDKSAFSTSDTQVAQIFAQQLSSAIVRSKQNALLADRDDAFRKAYEKNFDASEAIVLKDREREARLSGGKAELEQSLSLEPL